jgi:hypothetical protein
MSRQLTDQEERLVKRGLGYLDEDGNFVRTRSSDEEGAVPDENWRGFSKPQRLTPQEDSNNEAMYLSLPDLSDQDLPDQLKSLPDFTDQDYVDELARYLDDPNLLKLMPDMIPDQNPSDSLSPVPESRTVEDVDNILENAEEGGFPEEEEEEKSVDSGTRKKQKATPAYLQKKTFFIQNQFSDISSEELLFVGSSSGKVEGQVGGKFLQFAIKMDESPIPAILAGENEDKPIVGFKYEKYNFYNETLVKIGSTTSNTYSFRIEPLFEDNARKKTKSHIRAEISFGRPDHIEQIYQYASERGICVPILDVSTIETVYAKEIDKTSARVFTTPTNYIANLILTRDTLSIPQITKTAELEKSTFTELVSDLYNLCLEAGFVHGNLYLGSLRRTRTTRLCFSHLSQKSHVVNEERLKELAVLVDWLRDVKPGRHWYLNATNTSLTTIAPFFKNLALKYLTLYNRLNQNLSFADLGILQLSALPAPQTLSLFKDYDFARNQWPAETQPPVPTLPRSDPRRVIEVTPQRREKRDFSNINLKFGNGESTDSNPENQSEADDRDEVRADRSGRVALRSELCNFDIDFSIRPMCGTFGCVYTLKNTNPKMLMKIGRITQSEVNLSIFASQRNIGPKVYKTMPITLYKNGEDTEEQAFAIIMEAYTDILSHWAPKSRRDVRVLFDLYVRCLFNGFTHGDMKANNMVYRYNSDGSVDIRLIDFGRAELVGRPVSRFADIEDSVRFRVIYDWMINTSMFAAGFYSNAERNALLPNLYLMSKAFELASEEYSAEARAYHQARKALAAWYKSLLAVYKKFHPDFGLENDEKFADPLFLERLDVL